MYYFSNYTGVYHTTTRGKETKYAGVHHRGAWSDYGFAELGLSLCDWESKKRKTRSGAAYGKG